MGGRSKPPPWVRWAGEDLVLIGLDVRRTVDALLLGLVSGEPLDETIRQLQAARRLADDIVANGKDLQHAATINDLVEWALADDAFLTVLESKLEERARHPPGSRTETMKGGHRQS